PLTFLGICSPAYSAVFLKSRLRMYSSSPIPPKLTTDCLPAREVVQAAASAYFLSCPLEQRVEDNAFHLRFARQRLTNEIADEAPDHDVLAQFGNLGTEQIFDGHVGIFDKGLFKQANGAVEFLEFSFDNLLRNGIGLTLYLR